MIRSTKVIFENATSVAGATDTTKLFTVVNAKNITIEFTGNATFGATIQVITNFQGYTTPSDVYANATWVTVPAVNLGNFDVVNSIVANGVYAIDGGVAAIRIVCSTLSGGTLTARYSEVY